MNATYNTSDPTIDDQIRQTPAKVGVRRGQDGYALMGADTILIQQAPHQRHDVVQCTLCRNGPDLWLHDPLVGHLDLARATHDLLDLLLVEVVRGD